MIKFHVRTTDAAGTVGATLTKYGIRYNARIDLAGRMVIEKVDENGKINELASTLFQLSDTATAVQFKFANVDHQLTLQFGDKKRVHDLGRSPDDATAKKHNAQSRNLRCRKPDTVTHRNLQRPPLYLK